MGGHWTGNPSLHGWGWYQGFLRPCLAHSSSIGYNSHQKLISADLGPCLSQSQGPVSAATTSQTQAEHCHFWAPDWQNLDPSRCLSLPKRSYNHQIVAR